MFEPPSTQKELGIGLTQIMLKLNMSCIDYIFLIIGFCFSIFYGFRCFQIHAIEKGKLELETKMHQWWFNFVGAAIGWLALFIFYKSLGQISDNWNNLANIASALNWNHYILLLIGSMGIVGLLPYTLWSLSRTPDKFIEGIKNMFQK